MSIFPIPISFPVKFNGNGTSIYYPEKTCFNKSHLGKMLWNGIKWVQDPLGVHVRTDR
jgi:hypothetical protein